MPSIIIDHAAARAGAVSNRNSKMPGSSFAVTTDACKVGGKLRNIKGSTCSDCYAINLERMYKNVRPAWTRNLDLAIAAIAADPEAWANDMAKQIRYYAAKKGAKPLHRWFDGGDLQSVEMLRAIALVALLTPEIGHWIPTREAAMVKAYVAKYGAFPANLVVRISSTMVDDAPLAGHALTSTVHTPGREHAGLGCEARTRGNQCGPCSACWNAEIKNISYPLH